jgi:hypothetical protein
MASLPDRSAMVHASLRMRWYACALMCNAHGPHGTWGVGSASPPAAGPSLPHPRASLLASQYCRTSAGPMSPHCVWALQVSVRPMDGSLKRTRCTSRTASLGSPSLSLESLSRHAVHVHAGHLGVDVDAGPIRIGIEMRFW